ncbi:MAG TPA: MBL fold metallo-hydrolase [Kofleriaceae bacterium]|nr:MBL fold metallo-hydrolase [Kofleriaceae bacterium]
MAREADAIADNTPGELFVDATCIDCDLCRQLAPAVFARTDRSGQSYVMHQPDDGERPRALMALVTCPTSSIGSRVDRGAEVRVAARAFPEPIAEAAPAAVYFCGYASADSYGAASYLIVRPGGNVLVDSPRAAAPLVDRIAELGGIATMVLTHRDDVADHAKWRARFGCERVIHRDDVTRDTRDCERIVDGETALADDLHVIPVPGHTRGSVALLHRDVLFTGDHLWANDDETGLEAGRDVCWYSWPAQRRSVEHLAAYDFTLVLPGHGRRWRARDASAMRDELHRLAHAM